VHVRFNERTGLNEVTDEAGIDPMLTGGEDGRNLRARGVTVRSWIEGEESVEDPGLEDIDDKFFWLIDATPRPYTVSRVLRLAVMQIPHQEPCYLRSKISTIITTMRRTAHNIFMRSLRNAPAAISQTSLTVPLDIDAVEQFCGTAD